MHAFDVGEGLRLELGDDRLIDVLGRGERSK